MNVYVASSWRNEHQPFVCGVLRKMGLEVYDFRDPPGGAGFSWKDVGHGDGILEKGSDLVSPKRYMEMLSHPAAVKGFAADFSAMQRADNFVLILPCGKSAHLELGWAVGAGKRTAILLEEEVEPELMYLMVDFVTASFVELLEWLGAEDA